MNKDNYEEHTVWTEDEELTFLLLHTEYGNKWTDIAKYYSGKTSNEIKNHFYTIFRKYMRKILKGDLWLSGELEQLQSHYTCSLLLKYFTQPEIIVNERKDYLKTLITSEMITMNTALNYLQLLTAKYPFLSFPDISRLLWEAQYPSQYKRILPVPNNFNSRVSLDKDEKFTFFQSWMDTHNQPH